MEVQLSGLVQQLAAEKLPRLIEDKIASRIAAKDCGLWGPKVRPDATVRLGWLDVLSKSEPLIADIRAHRGWLLDRGIKRFVLNGMGGSSLAPTVISGLENTGLIVLDTTDPDRVKSIVETDIEHTAVIFSSKSGTTVEVDSGRRLFEHVFLKSGIDPKERFSVVTDPGSPLDDLARCSGYKVFNADPNVGGRYSALTAFGLVPTGLAGADVQTLLDEARAILARLGDDSLANPALNLGVALAARRDLNKIGLIDQTGGDFGDWCEQLLAESTGKNGKGVLPVVFSDDAPEISENLEDLLLVSLFPRPSSTKSDLPENNNGRVVVRCPLGTQFMLWEFATAVAGYLLGINPFNQPDVESAKAAARDLLAGKSSITKPKELGFGEVRISGTESIFQGVGDVKEAVDRLLAKIPANGYLSIQAYTEPNSTLPGIRNLLAKACSRPVTFGWGPRFLHSTGQYHKGGPAVGAYLQIITESKTQLQIPGADFTFGELIRAQAAGDAAVLMQHGRPVLTLHVPRGICLAKVLRG